MSNDNDFGFSDDELGDPGARQNQQEQPDDTVKVGGAAVKGLFNKENGLLGPANKSRFIGMVVVGTALLGSLVYVFFLAKPPQIVAGGDGQVERVTAVRENAANLNDPMVQESIRAYNRDTLPQVQANNPYALPLLEGDFDDAPGQEQVAYSGYSLDDDDDEVVNPFQVPARAQPTVDQVPVEQAQVPAQERQPRGYLDEDQLASANNLLQRLVQNESAQPQLYAVNWSYRAPARNDDSDMDEPAGQGQGDDEVMACTDKSVRAGEVLFATSDLALNSDVGGEVSFTIQAGELRGYKMLGAFERKEKWLRIVLNRIVAEDAVHGVNAIALDMDTSLNAVRGDVNYHIMYRYGWWGLGSVLGALGRAAELSAEREAYYVDGVVVENTKSTTSQELKIALGELGRDMGEDAKERINRPITVSLKRGEQVGVFVLDDICVK